MLAPILLANGTEEQKRKHLIPLGKGEVVWCEGFSEPNAGSDLFSLQTRAVDNGDCFIVNGQKIWTTGAHRSDWGFFLVRTDPNAPRKHLGISFLLIDMKSPGVSVRPIQNMAGAFDFCETFLDEVRVPKENLVGKLNDGARVAGALLNAERSSLILVGRGARRSVDRLTSYLKESEQTGSLRGEKEVWMYRLADVAIKAEIAGLFGKYAYWLQSQGQRLYPDGVSGQGLQFGAKPADNRPGDPTPGPSRPVDERLQTCLAGWDNRSDIPDQPSVQVVGREFRDPEDNYRDARAWFASTLAIAIGREQETERRTQCPLTIRRKVRSPSSPSTGRRS